MCGAIFAIGLACAAVLPAGVNEQSVQIDEQAFAQIFTPPLAIGFGVMAAPPVTLRSASPSEVFGKFDVSFDNDALFWRFNVSETFAQWNAYSAATNVHFADVIVPKRVLADASPRAATPTTLPPIRIAAPPAPTAEQIAKAATIVPSMRSDDATSRLPLATSVREGTPALAPLAFVRFCKDYASQCDFQRASTTVTLDAETWKLLEDVNLAVNRSIEPTPDAYESWDLGVKRGDCDDYAVEKRRQLIARGLPIAALSLTEVVARGEGHLVLSVRTDRGTFILDNLRETVVGWSMTGYRFVKIQSLEKPDFWRTVNGGEPAPVMVATRMARAAVSKKDAPRRNS